MLTKQISILVQNSGFNSMKLKIRVWKTLSMFLFPKMIFLFYKINYKYF